MVFIVLWMVLDFDERLKIGDKMFVLIVLLKENAGEQGFWASKW